MTNIRDFLDDKDNEQPRKYCPVEEFFRRDRAELYRRRIIAAQSSLPPEPETPSKPAAPSKPTLPKVKRHYEPPQIRKYEDVEIQKRFDKGFYASNDADAVKEKCASIDRHMKSLGDNLECKVTAIDDALKFMHGPYTFLLAMQAFVDKNQPTYDKFMPEVKKVLKIIENKSEEYHRERSKLIQQIYAPFQENP